MQDTRCIKDVKYIKYARCILHQIDDKPIIKDISNERHSGYVFFINGFPDKGPGPRFRSVDIDNILTRLYNKFRDFIRIMIC